VPTERTRAALRITALLMLLGAMAGALLSVPMTIVGKLMAGAAPADVANYLWNLRAFAILGAVAGPVLGWTSLRRVPLWRAALEPAVAGLLGAVAGFLIGTDFGFLAGSTLGIALATVRLNHVHRGAIADAPAHELAPPAGHD
jgi:hypothetical protein